MVARGKGRAIDSIASTPAFLGLPGLGKARILGFTRAPAFEVTSAGSRVNAVASVSREPSN